MHKMLLCLFVAGLLVAGSAAAQSNCSDGTIHDDNSFEAGYGFPTSQSRGSYVMRLDPPATPSRLDAVCVCFFRDGTDDDLTFDLNVWAANGPSGTPGTLLGRLSSRVASGIPDGGAAFYRYNLSALGIVVDGPVFIGPSWQPSVDQNFFLCADTNGPTSKPGYFSLSTNQNTPPTSPITFPNYHTLGVRAKFTPVVTGSCVENATTLCLNNGRFQVRATFNAPTGQSGNAQVVKLTGDTGYLWFFNPSNVEVVVKVLNGCGVNNRYWVFAGGLTNVRTVITVTDTQTGATKTYINPQGTAFQPIQDTNAFATCP
jgi:hypothetical protein